MLKYILTLLVLFVSLSIHSNTLKGKVVRVLDGDTVVLLDSLNTEHRIRLDGIDCPEKKQPFGNKATEFVKELTNKSDFAIVEWSIKDRYGRILGILLVDSVNVNKELLRNGLAWHYKHFNKDEELSKLEDYAKCNNLNIWSQKDAIEPWLFRKNTK